MAIFERFVRTGFWQHHSTQYKKPSPMVTTIKVTDEVKPVQRIRKVTISPDHVDSTYEILSNDTVRVSLYGGNTTPTTLNRFDEQLSGYISSWNVKIDYTTNRPPTKPGSINYPHTMRGGESQTITWGTAIDPDGNLDSYELQANLSGQGWTTIATTNVSTLRHVFPLARGTETIQFRVRALDTEGDYSDWTAGAIVSVINNKPIEITELENIGDIGAQNKTFSYAYSVHDPDGDNIRIEESLNGVIFKTLTNAPPDREIRTEITTQQIAGLEVNKEHKITIKAQDGQGHTTYAYVTFKRTNQDPVITVDSLNLGTYVAPFNTLVEVSDADGDPITVVWSIGGEEIGRRTVTGGAGSITASVPKEVFLPLEPGTHVLRVVATDDRGGSASRNLTFVRSVARLHVKAKHESMAFDTRPTHVLIVPTWKVAQGAIPEVLVCNNANDTNPTWEDCTTSVFAGLKYTFSNTTKTAAQWAIGVDIKIEKGTSTQESMLSGIGGAVE